MTMDAHFTATLASAPQAMRDSRAAATVKSERRETEMATRRRIHTFVMGMAIVAMGIFFGAALGICVAPSPARADGRRVATSAPRFTPASTVTSAVTPAAGVIRTKAPAPVAQAITSGKARRSAPGTSRSPAR